MALLHQPRQQLGGEIRGSAIPGLRTAAGELGEQLAFEQLLSGKTAGECLEISLAHEEARDQPDLAMVLAMVLAIFCRQYQVLNAIENLQQRTAGEIASDPPVADGFLQSRPVEALQQVVLGAGEAVLPVVIA